MRSVKIRLIAQWEMTKILTDNREYSTLIMILILISDRWKKKNSR